MRKAITMLAVVGLVAAGALAQEQPPGPPAAPAHPPQAHDVERALKENPLGDKAVRLDEIGRARGGSVHLVQVRAGGEVEANYHVAHDELIVLWRGKGMVTVGEKVLELGPGSMLVIPRGTVHAFKNTGPEPAVALATFTPGFDGRDRFLARDPSEPGPNRRLREFATALRAGDVETAHRMMISSAPQETMRLVAPFRAGGSIPGTEPLVRNLPNVLEHFPLLGGVRDDVRRLKVSIEMVGGPRTVVSVSLERERGEWKVAPGAMVMEYVQIVPEEDFARSDETDLKEVLRKASQQRPGLEAALAAMPSVKGLWPTAQRAIVGWQIGEEQPLAVPFMKRSQRWVLEE